MMGLLFILRTFADLGVVLLSGIYLFTLFGWFTASTLVLAYALLVYQTERDIQAIENKIDYDEDFM